MGSILFVFFRYLCYNYNNDSFCMKTKNKTKKIPESFKPLLWFLQWDKIDINEDKEDIIVNTINEGTLEQWQWLIDAYGRRNIRQVLAKRLAGEFHPESLNLATVIFNLPLLYAQRSAHAENSRVVSKTS